MIQPEAELLKVDVEVDRQLVVPENPDPLDKAVDDHFFASMPAVQPVRPCSAYGDLPVASAGLVKKINICP